MLKLLALGGSAAALLALPALSPVDALEVPSSKITVAVETVNGSGCPAGSASVSTSADNTSFRVTYRDYVAKDGAGAQPTEARRNCQVSVLINIPAGFTFAIGRADYRGDLQLARGATAQQNAYYYFMGSSPTAQVGNTFTGPLDSGWATSTVAPALVFAPCGDRVNLNINTDLRVNAGAAEKSKNYISMDASKGSINTIFHLAWKRCG